MFNSLSKSIFFHISNHLNLNQNIAPKYYKNYTHILKAEQDRKAKLVNHGLYGLSPKIIYRLLSYKTLQVNWPNVKMSLSYANTAYWFTSFTLARFNSLFSQIHGVPDPLQCTYCDILSTKRNIDFIQKTNPQIYFFFITDMYSRNLFPKYEHHQQQASHRAAK